MADDIKRVQKSADIYKAPRTVLIQKTDTGFGFNVRGQVSEGDPRRSTSCGNLDSDRNDVEDLLEDLLLRTELIAVLDVKKETGLSEELSTTEGRSQLTAPPTARSISQLDEESNLSVDVEPILQPAKVEPETELFYNAVWMHKYNFTVESFFTKDEMALERYKKELKESHVCFTVVPRQLAVVKDGSIDMKIECIQPAGMKMEAIGSGRLELTERNLQKTIMNCKFRSKTFPTKTDSIVHFDMTYTAKSLDADERCIEQFDASLRGKTDPAPASKEGTCKENSVNQIFKGQVNQVFGSGGDQQHASCYAAGQAIKDC